MKVCFLDQTDFKYSQADRYSPKLRGAETILINLTIELKKLGHDVGPTEIFGLGSRLDHRQKSPTMASHADKTLRNPCLDITSPPISLKE